MLGDAAMDIEIGRLLTMKAAAKLDTGDRAQKEVSMAKIWVSDILHKSIATAIQLNGARGLFQGLAAGMDVPLCAARRSWSMARPRFTRWSSPAICWSDGMDFWRWG